MIRVLVADDHPIYRDGLARTLADAGEIEVVGTAGDGEDAVRQVQALRPDLVLLDISMPKGGGMGALEWIMAMEAPPRVAMITASEEEGDLMQALKGGAVGYVLKGIGADDLVAVVRDLAAGRTYVSPGLAGRVLTALRARPAAAPVDPLSVLSKREEDILSLVAQGKSNKEVGRLLDLQEKTVKHYMTSILQKLHLRNRVEAALLMREHRKV
ncbi:response regulator [Neotabrizicola shimadae]|uniref:Response regulator transcription factor n=1 Tax=Neotabrizicola shimadae TaxID=2807096 RepID=A0A8G1ECN7_9RHOB|nr:response regulator transcription factor [Neotabrizicola shimadae]QYZ68564.1 response regulator transcription factor [Neotabrizicola shimadae]